MILTNTVVSGNRGYWGAGIDNRGTATLGNTTVSGNDARIGGGVLNRGDATLVNVTVLDNYSEISTGGIGNQGNMTLTNTMVSDNLSGETEGGIQNGGTLTVINSTVSDNSIRYGGRGGIDNSGALYLINTTVAGNDKIGISNHGQGIATLTNTTVSGNESYGIRNDGTATLTNTIVLGNEAEIEGTITEVGPNIVGGLALSQVFASVAPDPKTGVEGGLLADNGGAVETIALKNDAANPAVDAGQDDRLDESVVGIDFNGDGDTDDVIDRDGRGSGFSRTIDLPGVANNGANVVDLGAFEAGAVYTNIPPTIVTAATALAPELQKEVVDVETSDDFDAEFAGLTYGTSGGADEDLFDIKAATGVLTFVSAPDFENPDDSNGDNNYEVQVTVEDRAV